MNFNNKNLVIFLATIYLILLLSAGHIIRGILYADLMLPIFFALTLVSLNRVDFGVLAIIGIMTIYILIVSIINIQIGNNSTIMAMVVSLRFLAFGFMLLMGYAYYDEIIKGVKIAAPIVLLLLLFVTFDNYMSGQKAYYSFVQIPSTWSPAASGFTLSALGMYFLLFGFYKLEGIFRNFFYGISFAVLGLLTFSNSSFGALSISLLALLLLKMTLQSNSLNEKIKYLSVFIFLITSASFFYDELLNFFWRVQWMIINLEFRLNKVDEIKHAMCQDILCKVFGSGPGSHSFHSGAVLGQTAVLAFDQLHGRILVEWGLLGSALWFFLVLKIILVDKYLLSAPIFLFVIFGFLFGIGSEFIFENYSGQLYGLLLGSLAGYFVNARRVVYK